MLSSIIFLLISILVFLFDSKTTKPTTTMGPCASEATATSKRPLFSETLYNPRNEEERRLGPGFQPYRSQEQCSAHAESLLPEIPETGGVLVKLEFAEFYTISVRHVERLFPKDVTITDVQNLCVASGLEPGTFELHIGDSPVTGKFDLKLSNGSSENQDEEVNIKVGHSMFYLERRIGH